MRKHPTRQITIITLLFSFLFLCNNCLAAAGIGSGMISADLGRQPFDSAFLSKINLKSTLVQLKIPAKTSAEQIEKALHALVARAADFNLIDGVEIDSNVALSHTAASDTAALARKSVFFSAKFTLEDPNDWLTLLNAEQNNHDLLSTVYGAKAITQIMSMDSLASHFATTGVAFTHIFAPEAAAMVKAKNFWSKTAETCAQAKQPLGIILLQGNTNNQSGTDTLTQSALSVSDGYLVFVGNNNRLHFMPVDMQATSLTVWRLADGVTKGFAYQRKDSPQGLFLALGTSNPSFLLVKALVKRTQQAAAQGISLLGDAENNIHTFDVLLDFANTAIAEHGAVLTPPTQNPVQNAKFNLVLLNPDPKSISSLFHHQQAFEQSIRKNAYFGLFDYSRNTPKSIYDQIGNLLSGINITSLAYNTGDASNLKQFLVISKQHHITDVYLGPDASLLYLGSQTSQITSNVKVHPFLDT